MTVDTIYQFTLKLIRKNQSSGLSSTEFAYHWNDAQATYQDDLLGRFQRASNGKSGANTGLIENRTIKTKLTPFTKLVTITANANSQFVKPSDFIYSWALRVNGAPVFDTDHDTQWSLNSDVIDPPSVADNAYYFVEYQNYFLVYPVSVASLDLDYVGTPPDVLWNYTFDAQNRQVYNPTGSTDPLWDNNSCREITKRMLKTIGVSFQDKDFEGFGQTVINNGE